MLPVSRSSPDLDPALTLVFPPLEIMLCLHAGLAVVTPVDGGHGQNWSPSHRKMKAWLCPATTPALLGAGMGGTALLELGLLLREI